MDIATWHVYIPGKGFFTTRGKYANGWEARRQLERNTLKHDEFAISYYGESLNRRAIEFKETRWLASATRNNSDGTLTWKFRDGEPIADEVINKAREGISHMPIKPLSIHDFATFVV